MIVGNIYHSLYLPFSSPCINILWPDDSYLKFAQDPLYYFDRSLQMIKQGNIRENQHPIWKMGEGKYEIQMDFVHVTNFEETEVFMEQKKKST